MNYSDGFVAVVKQIVGKRLTYSELIGVGAAAAQGKKGTHAASGRLSFPLRTAPVGIEAGLFAVVLDPFLGFGM